MKLTYFGHSTFRLQVGNVRIILDPFLTSNPHGKVELKNVPCEYILCSHAHDDHIADALPLAKLHGATIIAPYELAEYFGQQGAKIIDLMPGGGIDLDWGRVDLTPAIHSSALDLPDGSTLAMGNPAGIRIKAGGRILYHAGDTALFTDMKLIGRPGLDVAMVPIGDRYTMGPADAVESLSFLRPKLAIPMHYNTTPKIQTDPHAFAATATAAGHTVKVMVPGEEIEV